MTNRITAGEYLHCRDLDIIDDFISDDELDDHRDELLAKMHVAAEQIEHTALQMILDLYHHAAAAYQPDAHICKDFDLRMSDVRQHLDDALDHLRNIGFFDREVPADA